MHVLHVSWLLIFQKYTRRRLRRHLLLEVIEVYFTFSKLLYLSIWCLGGRRPLLSHLPALHKPFLAFLGCVPYHRHTCSGDAAVVQSPATASPGPSGLSFGTCLRHLVCPWHGTQPTAAAAGKNEVPWAVAGPQSFVLRIYNRHSLLCLKGF